MIELDFSAAIVHVSHEALIFKFRLMGIGGTFLSIIIEFLTGRIRRVADDGQCSDYRNVISGVPQGSILILCYLSCILVTCGLDWNIVL